MGISFQLTGDKKKMQLEIIAEIGQLGSYVAVGFSTDVEMVNIIFFSPFPALEITVIPGNSYRAYGKRAR